MSDGSRPPVRDGEGRPGPRRRQRGAARLLRAVLRDRATFIDRFLLAEALALPLAWRRDLRDLRRPSPDHDERR